MTFSVFYDIVPIQVEDSSCVRLWNLFFVTIILSWAFISKELYLFLFISPEMVVLMFFTSESMVIFTATIFKEGCKELTKRGKLKESDC